MAVTPFTLYLIACIVASNTTGQQCKPSEVSIPDKALNGHTYTATVVSGPIQCQMLCENDPKCRSYNFHSLTINCEMNDETKETKPNDFVTDNQRFYMKREGGHCSYSPDGAGTSKDQRHIYSLHAPLSNSRSSPTGRDNSYVASLLDLLTVIVKYIFIKYL